MSVVPIVYVAGPYTAETFNCRKENALQAERVGDLVTSAGCFPIVPHAVGITREALQKDPWWIDATMEALQRCDAAVFLPSWMWSDGSRKERKDCVVKSRRVFDVELVAGGYSLPNEFHAWVKEFGRRAAVKEGAES